MLQITALRQNPTAHIWIVGVHRYKANDAGLKDATIRYQKTRQICLVLTQTLKDNEAITETFFLE